MINGGQASRGADAAGKEIVVFIHGHMGCAKQFAPMTSRLSGVERICLTLPGHETDLKSFLRTGARDWQGCVDDLLDELRRRYDGIILVGHSMGGLLAINAAVARPDRLKAIVAIALPLRIKISYRGLKIRARALAKPRRGEEACVSMARALNGVSGITAVNAIRLLPSLCELLMLMRRTRSVLPALRVPLTAIHSHNDEIVSAQSVHIVRQALPAARVVELSHSSHFWISEEDTARIVSVIQSCAAAQR